MAKSGELDSEVVVLVGGPLDGREHLAAGQADELLVVMSDGQRFLYGRSGGIQRLPDGRAVPAYGYVGRQFGIEE